MREHTVSTELWPSAGPSRLITRGSRTYNCQQKCFLELEPLSPMLLHLEDLSNPEGSTPALSALGDAAWKIELTQHFQSAGLVILIYDYFLTLSDEIRYIWPSKWSWVKIVFLMNRYISPLIVINALIMVAAFTFDVPRCRRELFAVSLLNIFIFATWNVLLTLRVHALWGASRRMGIALAIADTGSDKLEGSESLRPRGSGPTRLLYYLAPFSPSRYLNRSALTDYLSSIGASFHSKLLFETVVFLMTMYKVLGRQRKQVHSIASIILRDGVIYFVTIFGARVANMTLYVSRDVGRLVRLAHGILANPTPPRSTMVSRMTLNLRMWRTEGTERTPVTPRQGLSHYSPAVGDRVPIHGPGTGIRPFAGTNEPMESFLVLGSKNNIPLKIIGSKV
ncbi:hypothetical protein BS47DRAFT_1482520 [Hydnum rufescens UP504]|uniref:DUF6533 domain-containing protein n=1 Tax=Hydnum rufescens UP504 TaxID=1448309 RepID=A0A9P6E152_9AGAM|nr:hypothetical protein BS47DRAFT_1482520 [Hydnum rufescens UP504]